LFPHQPSRFVRRGYLPIELGIFNSAQYLIEKGSWRKTHRNEIISIEQPGRMKLVSSDFHELAFTELIVIKKSMTSQAVQTMQFKV
jgi:hypothetical protein